MSQKANARILIEYTSPRDGLKVYGKKKRVPKLLPGDVGRIEELSRLSIEGDKTHAFYPAKWDYTWMIRVSPNQFELL